MNALYRAAQAFDLTAQMEDQFNLNIEMAVPLPGGEGRCFRVGAFVLRHENNIHEAESIAELYHVLQADIESIAQQSRQSLAFRVPRPQPLLFSHTERRWISSEGWSAWEYFRGRTLQAGDALEISQTIEAVQAFHQALKSLPCPIWLKQRDSLYDKADRQCWSAHALWKPDRPDYAQLLGPLLQRLQALPALQAQLIHGDLNPDNILIAPHHPPALIDFTPYWRPPDFALAIMAYWLGPNTGDCEILKLFQSVPYFPQLLLRACLRTVLIDLGFVQSGQRAPEAELRFGAVVRGLCQWYDCFASSFRHKDLQ